MKLSKTYTMMMGLIIFALMFSLDAALAEYGEQDTQENNSSTYTITEQIAKKRPEFIVTGGSAKFMINSETRIHEADGDPISLKYLQFPCKAEIVFYGPQKGSFYVKKISVIETSRFSGSQWSEIPE